MKFVKAFAVCLTIVTLFGAPQADAADVVGGQTNVLLNTDILASAAGLTLSGVSNDVIVPGDIPAGDGEASVAFSINSRNATAPLRATTFSYDPADFLGTFTGTIEHAGSVFFNDDAVEVGNFAIDFDAARVGTLDGNASGFFVASTVGIAATLFDVANPNQLSATDEELVIGADLLVSPEFASFLLGQGLATADLSGAAVGGALVDGIAVPEPASGMMAALGMLIALGYRRKS